MGWKEMLNSNFENSKKEASTYLYAYQNFVNGLKLPKHMYTLTTRLKTVVTQIPPSLTITPTITIVLHIFFIANRHMDILNQCCAFVIGGCTLIMTYRANFDEFHQL